MIIFLTCLAILICCMKGEDFKSKLDELKNVDWKKHSNRAWTGIKKYAKKFGRVAATPLLKLWFVLQDPKTTTFEKALIYAAIIYTVSPVSFIPASLYRFLGILDEGAAILYVVNKVKDKMTPAIEAKVKDTLDEWFGPEYSVSDVKA